MKYNCLACGKENTFSYSKRNKYCNTKCQTKFQYTEYIRKWKEGAIVKGTSNHIKRYVLEKQENRCFVCSIDSWNGKPLVLELEHKDGDATNNSEENLCCLCPNCHSQTPTFKGRNMGNGTRVSRYNKAPIV